VLVFKVFSVSREEENLGNLGNTKKYREIQRNVMEYKEMLGNIGNARILWNIRVFERI